MSNSSRSSRKLKLLASASIAILAPNAALAAEVVVTDTSISSPTLNSFDLATRAFESVYSYPLNSARVSAVVTATGGVTRTDTWNGSTVSSSNAATTNELAALAIGNTFTNSAPLTVLDSNLLADGLASSGVAVNTGYVTSLVELSNLTVSLTNAPLDSSTNSTNVIKSTTVINSGTTNVSGQVPNTYASTTGGSGFINQFADSQFVAESEATNLENFVDGDGSVVLSSLQRADRNLNDSFARTFDNNVILDLVATNALTMTGSGTLDDNTVSASFTGNSSTSLLGIQGGERPAFTGSATVVTSQTYSGNDLESSNNASNIGTDIQADVYANSVFESEIYTLTGSVTVDGNSILSAATGNASLGNALTLEGGINLDGATASALAYSDDTPGRQQTSGTGSLVVASNQLAQNFGAGGGSATSSGVYEATISGYVDDISGGSLSVSNNTISSVARNNNYAGEIATTENVTTFSGGVAYSVMQSAEASAVVSDVRNTLIDATAGQNNNNGILNGSLLALDNTVSAMAYGNQGDNLVSLETTSLNTALTGAAALFASTEGYASGSGSVVLSSVQAGWGSTVSAQNTNSRIIANSADQSGTDGSTVTVGSNRQEAVAVSNLVSNGVDLKATTIGSGIGLVSLQKVHDGSDVTANLQASASIFVAEDLGDPAASTASLIDNLQRAIGYDNSATNSLAIEATTANVVANYGSASEGDLAHFASNNVNAAYSLLNTQLAQGNVSARVAPDAFGSSLYELNVGLDVQDGSAAINDRNTALAAAYGNQAVNAGSLKLNSVEVPFIEAFESGITGLVNVTSAQYLDNTEGGGVTISAQVSPLGDAGVLTYVSEDLFAGSSVSTSSNTLQAQTVGNQSGNKLDVMATQLTSTGSAPRIDDGGDLQHSIGVNNLQDNDLGVVTSTLRDAFAGANSSIEIKTFVGGRIADSSAESLGNALIATAGSNLANNAVSVTTTGLEAGVGLNNLQRTSGDTIATIGLEGTPAIAAVTSAYTGTGSTAAGTNVGTLSAYNFGTGLLTVADGETVTLAQGSMSQTEWNALVSYLTSQFGSGSNLWTASSASTLSTTGNGTYDVGIFTGFTLATGNATGNGLAAYEGFSFAGTAGNPASGGVFIETNDLLSNATVRVDGNNVRGNAIGNDAANRLTVEATTVARSGQQTRGQTGDSFVDADIALGNWQDATETSSSVAEVISTFHVDQEANNSITNSLVSVSGNKQSATAVANLGDSALTVTATDLASDPLTIGLGSAQEVFTGGVVDATSVMEVFAPIQSTGSTITLNDNSNRATGIFNDATNALSVSGTNIASVSGLNALYDGGAVAADVGLENTQRATGTLSTEARTSIFNQYLVDNATNGVINGTVEVNGNLTAAESTANRAANSATLNGSASQGAGVGLANIQDAASTVTALAVTTATLELSGTDDIDPLFDRAPLNSSSASMDGNVTQALARGNAASNALNSNAGATYPAIGSAGSPGSLNSAVEAAAVVANRQQNTGDVTATARATYTVVLNSATAAPSVSSSSVSVASNVVAAVAYGNQASNQLTLTPLNSGLATGAVSNTQFNSGAIRAEATSVTFNIGASAGTSNASAFRTTGNAITATAVGNSVTSAIIGR